MLQLRNIKMKYIWSISKHWGKTFLNGKRNHITFFKVT